MIQEDKNLLLKLKGLDLLLKDLCARLPYDVKVEIDRYYSHILKGIDGDTISTDRGINYPLRLVKPYLRPISSMTEEEEKEYHKLCDSYYGIYFDTIDSIDWLNSHHFDYRGLIRKGLAIEAPEEMYEI